MQHRIKVRGKIPISRITECQGGYSQVTDHITLSLASLLSSLQQCEHCAWWHFSFEKPVLSGISHSHSPVRGLRRMPSTELSIPSGGLPAPQITLQGVRRSGNIVLGFTRRDKAELLTLLTHVWTETSACFLVMPGSSGCELSPFTSCHAKDSVTWMRTPVP